jgi:hypothetical protein
MAHAPFDPTRAVTFDLEAGQVHLGDSGATLLVPAGALGALCDSAGEEAARAFGRAVGSAVGARVAARLAASGQGGAAAATVEAFAQHLAGELALAGLGAVELERWGKALVVVLDNATTPERVSASVLEAGVEAATGRAAVCVPLTSERSRARYLVTGADGAALVRTWLAAGASWGEALVRLHESGAPEPRGEA